MRLYTSMFFFILIFVGCSNNSGLLNFSQLVNELEKEKVDFTIIENDEKDQFLSVAPKIIEVDGEFILIYEYQTKKDMDKEAATIHENGNIGNAKISYVSDPHYFKKGNIIVHYTGENKVILKHLKKIFGKQFAGR